MCIKLSRYMCIKLSRYLFGSIIATIQAVLTAIKYSFKVVLHPCKERKTTFLEDCSLVMCSLLCVHCCHTMLCVVVKQRWRASYLCSVHRAFFHVVLAIQPMPGFWGKMLYAIESPLNSYEFTAPPLSFSAQQPMAGWLACGRLSLPVFLPTLIAPRRL